MAKKQKRISLTYRIGQGYSKDCGAIADDETGARKYKRWYFGHDKADAERLAGITLAEWRIIRLNRGDVWTPAALHRIEFARLGTPAAMGLATTPTDVPRPSEIASTAPASSSQPPAPEQNIHKAMVEYETVLDQRAASGQISDSHRISQQGCLRRVRKMMPDMPMSALGYAHLVTFANKIAARPMSVRGTPISVASVWNTMTALKLFLTYLEDSGQWHATFNWRRALRLKRACLITDDERETIKQTPTFSADDLRKLWNKATERTRLYLLLALNTGATQTEIASLRLKHVHLDDKQPYIERPRNKTKVPGRWPLWKETVTLLQKYLAPTSARRNPKGLALLNDDGDPLLVYRKAGRNDAITKAWQRLVYGSKRRPPQYKVVGLAEGAENPEGKAAKAQAEFRKLPFKYLRKTCYSWIKQRFGTDVAEWFAQHKENAMVGAYSDPDFKKVSHAVNAMRSEFLPTMFKDSPNALRPSVAEMLAPAEVAAA